MLEKFHFLRVFNIISNLSLNFLALSVNLKFSCKASFLLSFSSFDNIVLSTFLIFLSKVSFALEYFITYLSNTFLISTTVEILVWPLIVALVMISSISSSNSLMASFGYPTLSITKSSFLYFSLNISGVIL